MLEYSKRKQAALVYVRRRSSVSSSHGEWEETPKIFDKEPVRQKTFAIRMAAEFDNRNSEELLEDYFPPMLNLLLKLLKITSPHSRWLIVLKAVIIIILPGELWVCIGRSMIGLQSSNSDWVWAIFLLFCAFLVIEVHESLRCYTSQHVLLLLGKHIKVSQLKTRTNIVVFFGILCSCVLLSIFCYLRTIINWSQMSLF